MPEPTTARQPSNSQAQKQAPALSIDAWKKRASEVAQCDRGTGNLAQNILITKAYADLYISRRKVFKWAGMAAFASQMVGQGMAVGKAIDIVGTNFALQGALDARAYGRVFNDGDVANLLQKRLNVTDLDNMLIAGNKAVFRDIYWQHIVYRDAGPDELIKLLESSPIEGKQTLIKAWRLIATGEKNSAEGPIWEGNTELLRYEQTVTLQIVYDQHARVASRLSDLMISPLPSQFAPFRATIPKGSVGVFANRWGWIETNLIPHWKYLDQHSFQAQMQLLSAAVTPKWYVCREFW